MEKHKNKALEKDCLCSKCMFRFQCFTQERVFSDPVYQGLFEALIAQGKSRDEAIDAVAIEIKFNINKPITLPYDDNSGNLPNSIQPYVDPSPNTVQPYFYEWTIDSATFEDVNNTVVVTYTMHDGEKISWLCK